MKAASLPLWVLGGRPTGGSACVGSAVVVLEFARLVGGGLAAAWLCCRLDRLVVWNALWWSCACAK